MDADEWKRIAIELITAEKDERKLRKICRLVAAIVGLDKRRRR